NNDEEIGNIIAEAMDKVGKNGVITVEEARGLETVLEVVEGMQFDRGYLSPHFVTDPERMVVVLEIAKILIHAKKSSQMKDLLQKAGTHRQGRHHSGHRHGRQGPQRNYRRSREADPSAHRGHHVRLRSREAAGALGQARRWRRADQGRRRYRDRDEGEEGPRR